MAKLLMSVDASLEAEIIECVAERKAALDRYVAASSRLAELEALRDLRAAMGATVLGHLRMEVA